jgi:hypothetical protein
MCVLALLVPACTSDGGGPPRGTIVSPASGAPTTSGRTYRGNGVSFSYPAEWKTFGDVSTSASAGDRVWGTTVGLDGHDLVNVARYTLSVPITDETIATRTEAIRAQLENLFAQAGGSLSSGPSRLRMADLPALAFAGTAHDPEGRPVHERLVLAFDGTSEYFVNCQYDDAARTEILAGCDQIVSSFEVTA